MRDNLRAQFSKNLNVLKSIHSPSVNPAGEGSSLLTGVLFASIGLSRRIDPISQRCHHRTNTGVNQTIKGLCLSTRAQVPWSVCDTTLRPDVISVWGRRIP